LPLARFPQVPSRCPQVGAGRRPQAVITCRPPACVPLTAASAGRYWLPASLARPASGAAS